MKKKLLHLQLLPILSGVQRFSLHLLDGLNSDEYDVFVAGKPGGELVDEVRKRGWKFLPIYSFRHPISPMDIFAFFEITYLLKKHKFDIVHTNSSKPGLLGRIAAHMLKIPLIVHTIHGTSYQDHQHGLVQKGFMELEKLGNRYSDYTIFVNNSDRLGMLERGLITEDKAITIFNAMPDDGSFDGIGERKLNEDKIVFGSTLRFSMQKNVIALTTAACKACIVNKNLHFIFLGDGEHLSLCRQIVGSYRLSERILMPGWDSQVLPWLKLFDAFILYSRWEAMPFSIIEAMKAGLPVLGSSIPSISELVDDKSGWLVALDDESALVQTLGEICKNPTQILKKGKYARRHINELCNYENMVQSYDEVYQRLNRKEG